MIRGPGSHAVSDLVLVSIVMNAEDWDRLGEEGGGALMVMVIKLTMETPETWN